MCIRDSYYGEESLQAAVPELSSKVFTVDLSDGLSERVKESPLFGPMVESSGIDVEAIKEYMENAAEQARENGGSDPYDIKGLMQRYKDGCQAKESFKAAMTVEKAGKASFVMDGAEAVSYTHLDVYKRQHTYDSIHMINRERIGTPT